MAAPRFAVPPGGVVSKGLVYTDQQVAQSLPPASLADYTARKAAAMTEDGKGSYVSIGGRLYPMWWLLAGGGALLLGGIYIVTR